MARLDDIVHRQALLTPHAVALKYDTGEEGAGKQLLTYADLQAAVLRLTKELHQHVVPHQNG